MLKECFKHFKTITKHRWIVLKEMTACGLFWQGLVHDLSKYGPTEFISSAKYFQGDKSPIEAEKEDIGYSAAWLHHKSHNKHHWEYWTDFDDEGNIISYDIPINYIIEMVCDYIAAGQTYSGEKWTVKEPLNYFNKVRKGRYFSEQTEDILRYLLGMLYYNDLNVFHRHAREFLKKDKSDRELKREHEKCLRLFMKRKDS